MAFTEISYEEIGNESDYSEFNRDREEKKESLNPQISRGFQELDPVVYYKNPIFQAFTVFALGTPLVWFLWSAFSPPSQSPTNDAEPAVDRDNARMQQALEEERAKNQALLTENALQKQRNQKIEVVTPDSSTEKASQSTAKISQPVEPKPVATTSARTIRPQPQPQPVISRIEPKLVAEQPEPEIDPMEKWLASANQGHYVTAMNRNVAEASATLTSNNSNRHSRHSKKLTEDKYPLYANSLIEKRLNSSAELYKTTELKQRIKHSSQYQPASLSTLANNPLLELADKSHVSKQAEKKVDIGSSVEATLENSVVWTNESVGFQNNKKYLLRLQESWKNASGEEILPEGTRIIAETTELSNSGLLFMEVTEIVGEAQKINIPAGAIQVESKDGSPLKAELKQKGGSNFANDLGSIVAPGIERAFDSLSNSADTLIFEDGNSSILRTRNSRENPLASGVSGAANGVGEVLNRRLQKNDSSVSAYFQLERGEKVRLVVYENFSI